MIDEDGYFDPDAEANDLADARARADARAMDKRSSLDTITANYAGRQFLWDLLATCGVWSASYGADMAFREGQRDIGIRVMREIEAMRPGILHEMSSENLRREARYLTVKAPEPKE